MSDSTTARPSSDPSVIETHRRLLGAIRGVENIVEASCRPACGDVARRLRGLAQQVEDHLDTAPDDEVRRHYREFTNEVLRLASEADHACELTLDSTLGIAIRRVVAALRSEEAQELTQRGMTPRHPLWPSRAPGRRAHVHH